jgi:hypothetical protein
MHARHLIVIAAPTGHACPPTAITLRRRETVGARRQGQWSLGFWLIRLEHRPVSLRKTQVVTKDYEEEEAS